MILQPDSSNLSDYLTEIPGIIEFSTPGVQATIHTITQKASTDYDRARLAFEYARDEIRHSFDTKSSRITISAEDAIIHRDGICFAKSHVLASVLRGMGIPAGFCYQRVLRKGTVESGHALHGLNAMYLPETGWFRVDPRGNKPGVNSQFSTETEQLAYPIRPEYGEVDYPQIFARPLQSVIEAMRDSANCDELFFNRPDHV
ncbi:MAG: transglutaminase domain-containing protein [Chlorobi bacterium]|nr:MAG: transglutaminase domain-containing protein [Bacteroidota bacterium]KXK33240.1 MAG: Transglutaminase-like superfamily protein [Chlorobi bacterium OLB6]MBE2265633.1 transglutaminase domain-containing protein [Flavobacteriales bacterium]MBL1160375.1 transglutaminase domain-containing protein [Chlorobiota bacterium]MBW7853520.1 transglutaminase domain-containing protein [Candidatus Kapabacteria bacterium]MCC6331133.1 transglutaminase domain-containing protein [Ignavibacteria bacterium]